MGAPDPTIESTDHPVVQGQDELAALYAQCCTQLVGLRVRRMLWLSVGWTGRQALLVHGRAEVRDATVLSLRQEFHAYEEVNKEANAWWQRLAHRCPLQLLPAVQLRDILAAEGWRAPLRSCSAWCVLAYTASHRAKYQRISFATRVGKRLVGRAW
jgi:hypothetical protein